MTQFNTTEVAAVFRNQKLVAVEVEGRYHPPEISGLEQEYYLHRYTAVPGGHRAVLRTFDFDWRLGRWPWVTSTYEFTRVPTPIRRYVVSVKISIPKRRD